MKSKKNCGYVVKSIDENSLAFEAGIKPGYKITRINNQPFLDIIDYEYFCSKKRVKIEYIDEKNNNSTVVIRKNEYDSLGIDFEGDLLGKSKYCGNNCIFCFVDQLPKNMRKSLYHKDEDWRYSFIYGNYVTLSTISKNELNRIINRKISNLFISVHAVNNDTRELLLGNKQIIDIKTLMRKLARNGVVMHTQIVLCRGINDGQELKDSYMFLKSLYPYVKSVSVIPTGLTQFRDKLYKINDFTTDQAKDVIKTVKKWNSAFRKEKGVGFIYASDEMFLKAKMQIPNEEYYDEYPQIENGVGFIRKFDKEFNLAFDRFNNDKVKYKRVAVLTGSAFYKYMKKYCEEICKITDVEINCYECKNDFFMGKIDVAGLLTASDIKRTLEGEELFDVLMISRTMIKENDDVFLDDVSVEELEKHIGYKIACIPNDGYEFVDSFFE